MEPPTPGEAATQLAAASTDVEHEDFARLCLDPTRLAALGRAVERTLSADALSRAMDIRHRDALEVIADLRLAGLIDADGGLQRDVLREIAGTLPQPEPASVAITTGDWSEDELKILRTFFSGDRLEEIPSQRRKRRLVLERIAQDFEPGVLYDEPTLSEQLRTYNDDYVTLRRHLIDEQIMTRADGVYWRSGGRFPVDVEGEPTASPDQTDGPDQRSPILRTGHPDITLAPFSLAHRAGLLGAADDERIARHMFDQFPYPYTGDAADTWISKCLAEVPPVNFAILVAGVVAGGVGCEPRSDILSGSAEMGWWLAPRWWGRGITAIAVGRLIEYCFEDLNLHRVEAGVFLTNTASARVAEKAGLVLEGIASDGYLKDGRLIDRLYYGLARSSLEDADSVD